MSHGNPPRRKTVTVTAGPGGLTGGFPFPPRDVPLAPLGRREGSPGQRESQFPNCPRWLATFRRKQVP
ncbi:MAG: hypothetical protein ACP5NF_03605 [Thermoanaerobaculum sp.]